MEPTASLWEVSAHETAPAIHLVPMCPRFPCVANVLVSESQSVCSDIPDIGEPSEGLPGSAYVLSVGTDSVSEFGKQGNFFAK